MTDSPDAKEAPPFRGDLRFEDVTFSYKLDAEDVVGDEAADSARKVALRPRVLLGRAGRGGGLDRPQRRREVDHRPSSSHASTTRPTGRC